MASMDSGHPRGTSFVSSVLTFELKQASGPQTRKRGQLLFQTVASMLFRGNLALSTGERPFGDILTSLRYWIIHSITIPSLFLAGWLFVASGLASEWGG